MATMSSRSAPRAEIEVQLRPKASPPPRIGEIIYGALNDRNMSLAQFVAMTDLSLEEVRNLLSDKGRMSPEVYDKIQAAFPHSRDYLFHVQEISDFYDKYGVIKPKNPIAQQVAIAYARLTKR